MYNTPDNLFFITIPNQKSIECVPSSKINDGEHIVSQYHANIPANILKTRQFHMNLGKALPWVELSLFTFQS